MVSYPALRSGLEPFIEWARRSRRCAPLTLPRVRKAWSGTHMDQNERWALAERLLTDNDLDLQTRVAGLFILLYGQYLSRVLAMRLPEHLTIETDPDTNVSRIDVLFGEHSRPATRRPRGARQPTRPAPPPQTSINCRRGLTVVVCRHQTR